MSMLATVDTLKLYKTLKETFSEDQANVLSETLKQIEQSRQEEAATKGDIKNLEDKIETKASKADLLQVKTELIGEIKAVKTELQGEMKLHKWMLSIVVAGVIALVMKSFFM